MDYIAAETVESAESYNLKNSIPEFSYVVGPNGQRSIEHGTAPFRKPEWEAWDNISKKIPRSLRKKQETESEKNIWEEYLMKKMIYDPSDMTTPNTSHFHLKPAPVINEDVQEVICDDNSSEIVVKMKPHLIVKRPKFTKP